MVRGDAERVVLPSLKGRTIDSYATKWECASIKERSKTSPNDGATSKTPIVAREMHISRSTTHAANESHPMWHANENRK